MSKPSALENRYFDQLGAYLRARIGRKDLTRPPFEQKAAPGGPRLGARFNPEAWIAYQPS